MNHDQPARTTADRAPMILLTVLAFATVAIGLFVWRSPDSSTASPLAVTRSIDAPPVDADPAVADLDADLADALRRVTTDAREDGVEIHVTSGRRSPAQQDLLLREAIARYGSEKEAARWVATPETSPHVSGDAVDIAPMAAMDWLAQRGAAYGLCQIYGNESWHYELRPDAVTHGCPQMYADPTEDPRMQ